METWKDRFPLQVLPSETPHYTCYTQNLKDRLLKFKIWYYHMSTIGFNYSKYQHNQFNTYLLLLHMINNQTKANEMEIYLSLLFNRTINIVIITYHLSNNCPLLLLLMFKCSWSVRFFSEVDIFIDCSYLSWLLKMVKGSFLYFWFYHSKFGSNMNSWTLQSRNQL